MEDIDTILRDSRRRALQPFLWCSVPGLVLVALSALLDLPMLAWIAGWPLLIGACVWAGVRWYQADRKAKESLAELQRFQEEHGL